MIDAIKKDLEPLVAEFNGSIGLYLSGGSDSLLLLRILLDMKADFSVISFDHTFTRAQSEAVDKLIQRFGLRVFSYPPSAMYLIGDGKKKVTLVEEYAFLDGGRVPFLRDCQQDDWKCVYDTEFKNGQQPNAPLGFKLGLFGTRKTDRHYSLGRLLNGKLWKRGFLTFYAPLYDLTRKEVAECLKSFGERPARLDTGIVPLCTKCLTATENVDCPKSPGSIVAPFDWDPQAMLGAFREKYGRVTT